MKSTYGNALSRHIKGAISDAAEVDVAADDSERHGQRVIVTVRRLAGGPPVMMARRHPAISGLSPDTLGHRFALDYEGFVAS